MKVKFTLRGQNRKLGPMPVSTTEQKSCPESCPLKKSGCYANYGPIAWHWKVVSEKGLEWDSFTKEVAKLPTGALWRHNQAGDLPSDGTTIDSGLLDKLIRANKGKRGFTYSHFTDPCSLPVIRHANENGFTINLSANNLEEVDELYGKGSPVVVVLEEGASEVQHTKEGHKVVVCPHSTGKVDSCYHCGICQDRDRDYVIGFPVHGIAKKKAWANTRE